MDWTLFFIFLAACAAPAATGAMFQPGQWYDALAKPNWTPPDWVFPVTWLVLYLCMANAGARAAQEEGSAYAMGFYAIQIAFNTLWTPVFFGLHRMKAALLVIACLWLAVAATTVAFWQLNLIAGILFIPYLIWVSIAAALNFEVWRLNRHTPIAT